jgi:hypothetical protein
VTQTRLGPSAWKRRATTFGFHGQGVLRIGGGADVLPILMSSLLAMDTAAPYALANRSSRPGGSGPGIMTKPRSCSSEAAPVGSSSPAAKVLLCGARIDARSPAHPPGGSSCSCMPTASKAVRATPGVRSRTAKMRRVPMCRPGPGPSGERRTAPSVRVGRSAQPLLGRGPGRGALTPRRFSSASMVAGRSVLQAHTRRCARCHATRWSSVACGAMRCALCHSTLILPTIGSVPLTARPSASAAPHHARQCRHGRCPLAPPPTATIGSPTKTQWPSS